MSNASLVSTDWLADHLQDPDVRVIEVDARGTGDYDAGHVPGAVGWFWKDALWDPAMRAFPQDAEFAARMGAAGVTREMTVVLYGAPVQYGTYAWWVLKSLGHPDVRLLDGAMVKWRAEERPEEVEAATPEPVTYGAVTRDMRWVVGRDAVMAAIDDPACVILDHRSPEEYAGDRVNMPGNPDVGAERYGRIPGAQHVYFDDLLNEDMTFKSREALADILAPHVPDRDTPVISYCRLSHRATLARFAMAELLGYTNVRVYDGSWTEWGSMVGMPIER